MTVLDLSVCIGIASGNQMAAHECEQIATARTYLRKGTITTNNEALKQLGFIGERLYWCRWNHLIRFTHYVWQV